MYESAPLPHINSSSVLKTIDLVKNTPKERFDPYLPTNNATRKLVESHVFVDGGRGLTSPLPTPALRNSLYLGKTEFQMNEDHFGKKSLVTNAQ